MIRVVNDSDNYTDFSMLEPGDVFFWSRYNGYFMKIERLIDLATGCKDYNAVGLGDGHLYLIDDAEEIIKAQSAKLTVEM